MTRQFDIAVVGGGILGTASALRLASDGATSIVLLEAEDALSRHQTGHNSGVIHSGLYYKPGSFKARYTVAGRDAMYRLCEEEDIPHERCGKLVVATEPEELPRLAELERRGRANGLQGLRRLSGSEIAEYEPSAAGIEALHVVETGRVDYRQVNAALARRLEERGGEIRLSSRLLGVTRDSAGLVLESASGEIRARALVNCGGLQSDRIARLCGLEPGLRIVPFRGEYYQIARAARHLVRNIIYPVPDPAFPFLGVHLTTMIDGSVEAGPNAVLALRREGYSRLSFDLRDTLEIVGYTGFRRLALRHWRMGAMEVWRSLSKRAFLRSLQRLVPALQLDDLEPGGSGVRAQAIAPDGKLVDDFHIEEADRMVHVLNAPSPAATAALAIGGHIADVARRRFGFA